MSNRTLIPALSCSVGNWRYYTCQMKYGEVARQFNFAYELEPNIEIRKLYQRGINNCAKGITDYLLSSDHRFLGGLVVAAWGGEPQYTPLTMEDPDGMLRGLDQGFGVLTFDGTQAYFVLDGQHRLRAIKDALNRKPEINKEDICVLIVTHYDTAEGRLRTRRLFSNINRNAKQTGAAENIALDEDDGLAILTRRLLDDHPFLKEDGRVRVVLGVTDDGGLRLASGSVPKNDPKAFSTFTVLYDMLHYLASDLPSAIKQKTLRPADDVLDASYQMLSERIDNLLKYCGNLRVKLTAATSAKDVRAPKNMEGDGHAFMRPVVQKAVSRALSEILQQQLATWDELMPKLAEMEWKMGDAPWEAVFSIDAGKMLTGKDNTELLVELLHAHLAPASKQSISRARKKFKDIRGKAYPISEEQLATGIKTGSSGASSPVIPHNEVSDNEEETFTFPEPIKSQEDVAEEQDNHPVSFTDGIIS